MNTDTLTLKEREVFAELVQGKSNVEIALEMELSEKTIKQHLTAIFKKLECTSRAQLIARHYMEQSA